MNTSDIKIILTHPCAGKTYHAKRDEAIDDPPVTQKAVYKPVTLVCRMHAIKGYTHAVAVDDETLKGYIKSRQAYKPKKWRDKAAILRERDMVISIAKELNLPLYKTITECLQT